MHDHGYRIFFGDRYALESGVNDVRRVPYGDWIISGFGSDDMDDSRMQARTVVTAMVARGFEPVRIERQLLVRAFDLVCQVDTQTHGPTQEVGEQSTVLSVRTFWTFRREFSPMSRAES